MSEVIISDLYYDKVLTPINKSGKIVPSILAFKDPSKNEVVINTCDTFGTVWLGIKASQEHFKFDDDTLGILDMSDFVRYMDLINYGTEGSQILRKEVTTVRGSRFDCLELAGPIGQFTMPLASYEAFQTRNTMIQKDRGEATENEVETLAVFKISKEELKDISDIGKRLDCSKAIITIDNDDIKLFFKGRGNNQYTKVLNSDQCRIETLEFENGETGTFSQAEDYEQYLPFLSPIFDLANTFGGDFTFEIRRNAVAYSLQAYGESQPYNEGDEPIRFVMMTVFNPSNVLSGDNQSDVFEFAT